MPNKPASEDKYRIQILSRAISVLFTFSSRKPEHSLDELAGILGINKTSLLRIVRTLVAEKFLVYDRDRYRLGPRVLDLGNVYLSTLSVQRVAQPYLNQLARLCDQTVSLALLDEFDVVYIGIEHAQREVGIQGEIGGRHPAHATGLGKVLLADLEESELDALLAGRELKRLTHRTIVNPELLKEQLERVRAENYALDDEERGIGIRCLAAPIRNHRGRVAAAISVAGPIFHMTDDVLPTYRSHLLETAQRISEQLGYSPNVPVLI